MVTIVLCAPELLSAIFSHFSTSSRSLARSSLVCHAWLPPTRSRLFHEIELSEYSLEALEGLVKAEHCTFISYVRKLVFRARGDWRSSHRGYKYRSQSQDDFLAELSIFLNVDSLYFQYMSLDPVPEFLAQLKPLVKSLELNHVASFASHPQLISFLSSFPLLERLHMSGAILSGNRELTVTWETSPQSTTLARAGKLKEVDLDDHMSSRLFCDVLGKAHSPTLRSLYLSKLNSKYVPDLNTALRAADFCLWELGLSLDDQGRCLFHTRGLPGALIIYTTTYSILQRCGHQCKLTASYYRNSTRLGQSRHDSVHNRRIAVSCGCHMSTPRGGSLDFTAPYRTREPSSVDCARPVIDCSGE